MKKENISSVKKLLNSIDENFGNLKEAMRLLDKESFEKSKNQVVDNLKKIEELVK